MVKEGLTVESENVETEEGSEELLLEGVLELSGVEWQGEEIQDGMGLLCNREESISGNNGRESWKVEGFSEWTDACLKGNMFS